MEGLAQVAESMSHMGIRTEGSGLPTQRSFCYTMLPLLGETGQSDGKGESLSRLWGSGKVLGTNVLVRAQRWGQPGSLEGFLKR